MTDKSPIILTGANGFCASRLNQMLSKTHEVAALSHRELDITDRDACLRMARELKPSAIVHSAAITSMAACEREPDRSFQVNVLGPENLAMACEAVGARLVHFSTDQVYNGAAQGGPHAESEPLTPRNAYGRQKKEAEERIARVFDNFSAIRLTWMYDFPVRHLFTSQNLLSMCRNAIYTNTPLTLPSTTPRGITFVHEVIENLPLLLQAEHGIYNFGSAGDISTYEAAKEVFLLLGAKGKIETLLLPEKEPIGKYADLRMDGQKTAQAGMRFSTTREGIRKAFAEYGLI